MILQHWLTYIFVCRYACEHCGKRFARGGQLMVHRRTHTGDKPYACTECPLRFTSSGNLKTHAKLHAGAREYQCHLCDKAYPRADTLKRHILRYFLPTATMSGNMRIRGIMRVV